MFSKFRSHKNKKNEQHQQQQQQQQQPQYQVDPVSGQYFYTDTRSNQVWYFNSQTNQWEPNPMVVSSGVVELSKKYQIPVDRLEVLRNYDIKFIIDDSGSMKIDGRMDEVKEVLQMMVDIGCKFDTDGVEIHFMNQTELDQNLTDSSKVNSILDKLKISGGTPTDKVLDKVLSKYFTEYESKEGNIKPLTLIILTDGCPNSKQWLEDVIVKYSQKLKDMNLIESQIGIQFFQVGKDKDAKQYLEYLDDGLKAKYKCLDIVDTVHFEQGGLKLKDRIHKALVGSIDPKVDKVQ